MSELKTGKYQSYPEYKDSGVECLGKVPEHWEVKKIKHFGRVIGGFAFKSGDFVKQGYPVIKITNVSHLKISYDDKSYLPENFAHDNAEYIAPLNSLVFAMTRPIISGGIKVAKMPRLEVMPLVNQRVGFIKIESEDLADYILFSSLSNSFITQFKNNMTITNQPNISGEGIESVLFPFPPEKELKKIANFLDHETAKIDILIEKQQQLIKLLKEKRQAVINHAVTKGLNPNAPMKDSGVEWLGEVPSDWDVINMHYVLNAIGDVDHYMPQSVDKGIPYVMTGDLTEFASNISFEQCKQVSKKDYLKLSNKIKSAKGDVIMARYATIGTVSYIDIDRDFLVSYSCVTIKPNPLKVLGLYLYYYFKSHAFLEGIQSQINTNTQGNVGVNDLKKIKVTLPCLTEQVEIIEYLQTAMDKLDMLVSKSNNTIRLSKERRAALISAAVTGKIDVRNWEHPND